jgi:endonuclease-3
MTTRSRPVRRPARSGLTSAENRRIAAFFHCLQSANPHPACELVFVNHYTFLVAIILSAQSTDKGVNKATPALFAIADTPAKMLELGESKLKDYIKTIGLYNNKAANIIKMSRRLLLEFDGQVPRDRDQLATLAGVGRKSANVFVNTVYRDPVIAVDTHVFRVSHRAGLSRGATPLAVEQDLDRVVPTAYKYGASHWLVLHGRYVCTAAKPRCATCPLADLCPQLL